MRTNPAQQNMIDGQLRPNGINDKPLLARFKNVPRELFCEGSSKEICYADTSLEVTSQRVLFSPLVTARLIQALKLDSEHSVLVVASGTGYIGALIAPLVSHVTLLEDNKHLTDLARHAMLQLDIKNVTQSHAAPHKGCKSSAPYDRIIMATPTDIIPQDILNQLKPKGEISAVLTGSDGLMDITHITTHGKTVLHNSLHETGTLPIPPSFQTEESFVF